MKKLTLLRHAKSSWADENQHDVERPLNDRGLRDAPIMAQRLVDQNCIPDFILCSGAHRTRQTAEILLENFSQPLIAIEFNTDLYLASAGTLLESIQQTTSDVQHLMIIGHNPGLETLGRQLHPSAPPRLPTCAFLHFAILSEEFTIKPDTEIELLLHDHPKKT